MGLFTRKKADEEQARASNYGSVASHSASGQAHHAGPTEISRLLPADDAVSTITAQTNFRDDGGSRSTTARAMAQSAAMPKRKTRISLRELSVAAKAVHVFSGLIFGITLVVFLLFLINVARPLPVIGDLLARGAGTFAIWALLAALWVLMVLLLMDDSARVQSSSLLRIIILFYVINAMVQFLVIAIVADLRVKEGWLTFAIVAFEAVVGVWAILTMLILSRARISLEKNPPIRAIPTRRPVAGPSSSVHDGNEGSVADEQGSAYGGHEHEAEASESDPLLVATRVRPHKEGQWMGVVALSFATFLLVLGFVFLALLPTINLIVRAYDATLPAPGHLYWVKPEDSSADFRVHLACQEGIPEPRLGLGADLGPMPTIVLETASGITGERFNSWILNSDLARDGKIGKVCWWDRPGYAFSDNAEDGSLAPVTDALAGALTSANEHGPLVLIANGYGGLVSRHFASVYPGFVKSGGGLLLIDTPHEADYFSIPSLSLAQRFESFGLSLLQWGKVVTSPLGIRRLVASIAKGLDRESRLFDGWTEGMDKAKYQEYKQSRVHGSAYEAFQAALPNLPEDLPTSILSSGLRMRRDSTWDAGQKRLVNQTARLVKWEVVEGAGHSLWREDSGKRRLLKATAELVDVARRHR